MSKLNNEKSKGSLKLGLNTESGNVKRERYKVSSLNLLKENKNTWIGVADYQYGKTFGSEDTRQGNAHLRYAWEQNNFLGPEVYGQVQFNKFQNLNSRKLLGAGYRAVKSFLDNDLKISIAAGTFFEDEELSNNSQIENFRMNTYYSVLFTQKNYSLSSIFYYQPSTKNFNDYRVNLNIGIETKFTKQFFQQVSYSISKDSAPPAGIARTDGSLLIEVGANY